MIWHNVVCGVLVVISIPSETHTDVASPHNEAEAQEKGAIKLALWRFVASRPDRISRAPLRR
jgi:hypothetical protein